MRFSKNFKVGEVYGRWMWGTDGDIKVCYCFFGYTNKWTLITVKEGEVSTHGTKLSAVNAPLKGIDFLLKDTEIGELSKYCAIDTTLRPTFFINGHCVAELFRLSAIVVIHRPLPTNLLKRFLHEVRPKH